MNEIVLRRDHLTDTGVDLPMSRAGDAAHARHFFGVGIRQSSSVALVSHWYMGIFVICRIWFNQKKYFLRTLDQKPSACSMFTTSRHVHLSCVGKDITDVGWLPAVAYDSKNRTRIGLTIHQAITRRSRIPERVSSSRIVPCLSHTFVPGSSIRWLTMNHAYCAIWGVKIMADNSIILVQSMAWSYYL